MVRVALCGAIACADGSIAAGLADCADERGLETLRIDAYEGAEGLLEVCLDIPVGQEPYDLVICAYDLPDDTGMRLARRLRDAGLTSDGLRIVLCCPNEDHASEAAARGVHGYLVEPVTREAIGRVVGPLIDACSREMASSVVLECRSGVHRVAFSTISHVVTTGREQVIYRTGRRPQLALRCSSRALFERLQHDQRFFKVGNSYIINLDQLSSIALRTGTATMLDGTQIAVPVRLRAQLGDAVCAHAAARL